MPCSASSTPWPPWSGPTTTPGRWPSPSPPGSSPRCWPMRSPRTSSTAGSGWPAVVLIYSVLLVPRVNVGIVDKLGNSAGQGGGQRAPGPRPARPLHQRRGQHAHRALRDRLAGHSRRRCVAAGALVPAARPDVRHPPRQGDPLGRVSRSGLPHRPHQLRAQLHDVRSHRRHRRPESLRHQRRCLDADGQSESGAVLDPHHQRQRRRPALPRRLCQSVRPHAHGDRSPARASRVCVERRPGSGQCGGRHQCRDRDRLHQEQARQCRRRGRRHPAPERPDQRHRRYQPDHRPEAQRSGRPAAGRCPGAIVGVDEPAGTSPAGAWPSRRCRWCAMCSKR